MIMPLHSSRMVCAAGICTSAFALAQTAPGSQPPNYPHKPIRMIVPSAPGGPADIVARTVGLGLSAVLAQQLVIDDRSGAGGLMGAELVARATPDGYTLLFTHSGPLGIAPLLQATPSYDPLKDFTAVSLVAALPMLLLVSPGLPAKNAQDLVSLAKSRPGKLNYASGGTGTGIHLAFELFNRVAGVKLAHVPYKGAAPGMTGLMSGEVDAMFNGLPNAVPFLKSGRLRALAVAGAKRTTLLPDLPTLSESGVPFDYAGWFALVGPTGMPRDVVGKLNAALGKALATADMKERMAGLGIDSIGSTPAQLSDYLRDENARLAKVIDATGLKGK